MKYQFKSFYDIVQVKGRTKYICFYFRKLFPDHFFLSFLFPFRDTTFPYAPDEFLSDHVEVLFMRMSVLGRNINPVLSILPDKFYLRPRLLQESLRTDRLLLRRFKEKYTAESCGSVLTDLYRRLRSCNRTIQTLSSKTVIEDRIR